ncbi:hypothetical protein [Embleya sp. NPDC020630]|uniref:hypothetical protein n=1 Tax=Embleya sp. NPDC020630 TaxID=3363979 RepID=UPI0037B86B88
MRASHLPPNRLFLKPGYPACVVCCKCDTWRVLHRGVVKPHDRPGTTTRRCPGGGQRITVDITVGQWWTSLTEADRETASRRATQVVRKPVAAPAPPVGEMLPGRHTPEQARRAYTEHREHCPTCTTTPCPTAQRLARTHAHLLREEPRRQSGQALLEALHQEVEDRRARELPRRRAREWARVSRSVTRTDDRRTQRPPGDAPAEWDVPTEPLDMAYAVLAHLGPGCEVLGDESLWQRHHRGGASMQLAPGYRLIWHADRNTFAVAASTSRLETTVTAATAGHVLAIWADERP